MNGPEKGCPKICPSFALFTIFFSTLMSFHSLFFFYCREVKFDPPKKQQQKKINIKSCYTFIPLYYLQRISENVDIIIKININNNNNKKNTRKLNYHFTM